MSTSYLSVLPDVCKHFAAEAGFACCFISHKALGSRDYCNAKTSENSGQLVFLRINSETRFGNTFNAGNNFLFVGTIFQADADNVLFIISNYFKIFYKPSFFKISAIATLI